MQYPREKKHRLPLTSYRGQCAVVYMARICGPVGALIDDNIAKLFITLLKTAAERFHCKVPIFCIMPDHIHIIFEGQSDDADTWKAMVLFKQLTGIRLGSMGAKFRWQKDFYDHVLRPDEDVRNQVRYIANNPVRKGLVDDWTKYPRTGSIGYDLRELVAYS